MRIQQAILDLSSQIGRRLSLGEFGAHVGRMERGAPWSTSAVSEWIRERSEPRLATFMAMARLCGHRSPSYLAFGDEEGRIGAVVSPLLQRELPPELALERASAEAAPTPKKRPVAKKRRA